MFLSVHISEKIFGHLKAKNGIIKSSKAERTEHFMCFVLFYPRTVFERCHTKTNAIMHISDEQLYNIV